MKLSSSYRIPLLVLAMIATTPQSSYAHLEDIMDIDKDFSDELSKAGCNNVDDDVIKVRQKIYALRSAKFFKDVEFKDDVEIEGNLEVEGDLEVVGTLSAADQVLGCDLTVGCNINMHNSTTALVGNVVKDGVPFINNFGTHNTFMGANAGNFTMTGTDNSGFGFNALIANTNGSSNTAFGSSALAANTFGGGNTAVGTSALLVNAGGIFNTAVGAGALSFLINGSDNTVLGATAGSSLTNGNNNIYIANAGLAVESNTIRIGTLGTQTAAYMQGIFGATVAVGGLAVEVDANGQLGTVVSSAEFKKNIQDLDSASDKLRRLRPVRFEYKNDELCTPQIGLIAQEVADVFPELVVYDLEGQPYSVRYQILPVLLLQELQRHQDLIDDLTTRVSQLEQLLSASYN
jgi:hypothetical protein